MHVYLEGGRRLRNPMKMFLRNAVSTVHRQSVALDVEPCGSRDNAIRRCANDVGSLLLIDSEGEDLPQLIDRVGARIGSAGRAFFMVQLMEAWFLADRQALAAYYGRGFNTGSLPANRNVEEILKSDVEDGLRNATRLTGKGAYHKGEHSPDLLSQLNPSAVYNACSNFAGLIDFLRDQGAG